MNILHVSNNFEPYKGGVEQVILQSCISMKKSGHNCEVICLNKMPNSGKVLPKSSVEQGIKVTRLPFFDFGIYKIAPKVFSLVKSSDADVVQVHGLNFFSDFLTLTKPFHKKKIIVTTHGGIFHTNSKSIVKHIYFYFLQRIILRFADKVIAVSKNDRQLFENIIPKEKIELLANPVDFKKFNSLKNNAEKNSFLFVGRFSRNKRIDALIKAFAIVSKEHKDAKLYLVGSDFENLKQSYLDLVLSLGVDKNVLILENLSDKELLKYYSQAQFFVSASEYEGFGITALESMAAGKIVFLNKIPAFESFVKNKENGFLTNFSNSNKAAETLLDTIKLSASRKQEISKNAVETAKKYSAENYGKKLKSVYEMIK